MKIFVMGMHRSGTSMVTGILSRCGMNIGGNLLMGARDNPKGHFEDRRFMNINNDLLIKNGGRWHSPPKSISYRGDLRNKMKRFLDLPEWKEGIVGWKDPRICITFPLWYPLITPESIRVVFVYRPINEIAASLQKRNGFRIGKGKVLAREYIRRAFGNVKGLKNVNYFITYYHSYFHSWRTELEELVEFLGLEIPKCEEKWIENFIDDGLRHHRMEDPYTMKSKGRK